MILTATWIVVTFLRRDRNPLEAIIQMVGSLHTLGSLAVGAVGLLFLAILVKLRRRRNSTGLASGRSGEDKSPFIETPRMKEQEMMPPEPIKKYAKPKIMLIDLGTEACSALSDVGYFPVEATFGGPYLVAAGDGFCRVRGNGARVPGLMEMEVLVIDLDRPEPREPTEPAGPLSAPGWWAKQTHGIVDPRPTTMNGFKDYVDRILSHRGLAVVFGAPRQCHEYLWDQLEHGQLIAGYREPVTLSNRSLFPFVERRLDIELDFGEEINVAEGKTPLLGLLRRFKADLRYRCTFAPKYGVEPCWVPLARTSSVRPSQA